MSRVSWATWGIPCFRVYFGQTVLYNCRVGPIERATVHATSHLRASGSLQAWRKYLPHLDMPSLIFAPRLGAGPSASGR